MYLQLFRLLLLGAFLLASEGCRNGDDLTQPTPGEEDTSAPIQLIPLAAPVLYLVEESLTPDGFTLRWEPDPHAAGYNYLINRQQESMLPSGGIPIQESVLKLSGLKAATSYRVSVCAEPRNTILYARSPWSEIEVQTAVDSSLYPDWPDEPGRPEVPIEPGEEVDLCVENLCGAWQLYNWSPSDRFPGSNTDIYMCFTMEGTFELYQKNVNVTGVVLYCGDYTLDLATRTIRGTYEDGVPWANSYWIETLYEHMIRWQAGEEFSEYLRIPEVPQQIRELAQPAADTRSCSSGGVL